MISHPLYNICYALHRRKQHYTRLWAYWLHDDHEQKVDIADGRVPVHCRGHYTGKCEQIFNSLLAKKHIRLSAFLTHITQMFSIVHRPLKFSPKASMSTISFSHPTSTTG